MQRHQTIRPASRWLYIVSLMLLVVAYRLFASNPDYQGLLGNTAPVMAMCFGGGLLLGRGFWWVPALLMIGSDVVLGLAAGEGGLGAHTLFTVAFFTVIAFAASQFGQRPSWLTMFGGTLVCSVLFYLAANTFAWIQSAGSPPPFTYPQTLAGWWQAQTTGIVGVPGVPPAWTFLRNALIGDTVWCLLAAPLFFWRSLRAPEPRAPMGVTAPPAAGA